jgi:transposase-like protein
MSDPRCPRCGSSMPILFHVIRYCPNDCDRLPPGPPCKRCGSTVTERFQQPVFSFISDGVFEDRRKIHCWPCGAVWNEGEE